MIRGAFCVVLWGSVCPPRAIVEPLRGFYASRIPTQHPYSHPFQMSQNYDQLVEAVSACREDIEKAEAGNKAATSRVRKSMQEIKAIAQELRKEMLEMRDAGGKS